MAKKVTVMRAVTLSNRDAEAFLNFGKVTARITVRDD